ncbi:hypothetical protein MMC10_004599 [Thelotrema lepadinum]|nr:hypothetical protein [Thelotrema lepadinum]
MKFSICCLLLTSVVSARPSPLSGPADVSVEPVQAKRSDSSTTDLTVRSSDANIWYTSNWAGAAILNPPSGSGTFSSVTAQFTIPSFSRPSGANDSQQYGAFYWVGIGTASVLQTGIGARIPPSGEHQLFAWYEWFPQGSTNYPTDLNLAVGDKIEMTVETAGPGSNGKTTVKNLSKNKSASKTLTTPNNADPGDQTAEWIVEEYVIGGEGTIPFVDFGSLEMTGCQAKTSKGSKTYGPQDGRPVYLKRGGKVAAEGSIPGNGEVIVKYTGP